MASNNVVLFLILCACKCAKYVGFECSILGGEKKSDSVFCSSIHQHQMQRTH